jgi:hypothetical protein
VFITVDERVVIRFWIGLDYYAATIKDNIVSISDQSVIEVMDIRAYQTVATIQGKDSSTTDEFELRCAAYPPQKDMIG